MNNNSKCNFAVLFSVLLLTTGCGRETGSAAHTDQQREHASSAIAHAYHGDYPIKILTTIGQVGEMISRIGGDRVEVTQLMGPGVDPHLYRPVASDIRSLREADAIFYSGLHLEGRMTELFEKMTHQKLTFAVTTGLVARKDERLRQPPQFAGTYDPHVWHDVALWSDCVEDAANKLAEYDPQNAREYQENAGQYQKELKVLDAFARKQLATIPTQQRVLVTAHDAFEYMGAAYEFEVYGLKGISTEEEKDLKHQEVLKEMIVKRNIPAIFVESAVAPKTVEALIEPCRAAGHDVKIGGELYADVLGPLDSDAETYGGMIRHNVNTIVEALSGK